MPLVDVLTQYKASHPKAGEVMLFREMLAYFKTKPNCNLIEKHQGYVRFINSVGVSKKCEISDLMVISYSRKNKRIRITFLQAKKADMQHGLKGSKFSFNFNKVQHELLTTYPTIVPINTGLPTNILIDAITKSITSYGVFYQDHSSNMNFAYEMAELTNAAHLTILDFASINNIVLPTYDSSIRKRICKQPCCHCNTCISPPCCYELISTINGDVFEDFLLRGMVGSPLCKHQAGFAHSINALIGNVNLPLAADFNSFVNEYFPIEGRDGVDQSNATLPCSLLLIKSLDDGIPMENDK